MKLYSNEKKNHPEGARFKLFLNNILNKTNSCFERDVIRDNIDNLWDSWKKRAGEFDKNNNVGI